MKPEISVIVPVYNVEKYVGRCIESLQNQDFANWEMILIDDFSPDKSYDVICKYAEKDNRIICLRQKENHGPMIARRLGDMAAQGNYITYCDGDDMLPPDALKSLYDAAIKTGADVVSGNRVVIKADGTEKIFKTHLKYGNDSKRTAACQGEAGTAGPAQVERQERRHFHECLCGTGAGGHLQAGASQTSQGF